MNKKLLALLVLPLVGMTACSGNKFKEVNYLKVNNAVLVAEKGLAKVVYELGTYEFDEADLATIRGWYVDFPASFNVYYSHSEDPNVDKAPFEMPTQIVRMGFTLKLNEASKTVYETSGEVFFDEGSRTIKSVISEEKLVSGSLTSAYYSGTNLNIEVGAGPIEYPTSNYKLKGDYVVREFAEKNYERYTTLGKSDTVVVAYK